LPQTRFLLLQPDRIDLPDQSFDLIFSFGVFQLEFRQTIFPLIEVSGLEQHLIN